MITKDVTTHIILTVIKSLFEKFLGIRKTGEFFPRADGWCSDSEIDFRFPFAGAPSRGGGIEQCSISQPRDEIHSYSPSTKARLLMLLLLLLPSHCNVIAGRKLGSTLEGVTANYRCAIRLVLTLIFACRRGGKETCRRGLNLGCVADRITNITHKWKH